MSSILSRHYACLPQATRWTSCDWHSALDEDPFDLIVSNPPHTAAAGFTAILSEPDLARRLRATGGQRS